MHHRINRVQAVVLCVAAVLVLLNLALLLVPHDPLIQTEALPYSTVYYDCKGNLLQVTSVGNGERREKLEQSKITM